MERMELEVGADNDAWFSNNHFQHTISRQAIIATTLTDAPALKIVWAHERWLNALRMLANKDQETPTNRSFGHWGL